MLERRRGFAASALALASMIVGLVTTQEKGRTAFGGMATGLVVSEVAEESGGRRKWVLVGCGEVSAGLKRRETGVSMK